MPKTHETPGGNRGLLKNCLGGTRRTLSHFCEIVKRHLCGLLLALAVLTAALLNWPRWGWLTRLVDRLTLEVEK